MEKYPLMDVLRYGQDLAWQVNVFIDGEPPFTPETICYLAETADQEITEFALSMSEIHDVIINARTQVVAITDDQLLVAFNYYCLHEDFLRFEH